MTYLKLAGCVGLPYVGGILGSSIVAKNLDWYRALKHPKLSPPPWLLCPVWSCLYGTMGIASYLVLREADNGVNVRIPLAVYGVHLLFNWSWAPVFFGLHKLKTVRSYCFIISFIYLFPSR